MNNAKKADLPPAKTIFESYINPNARYQLGQLRVADDYHDLFIYDKKTIKILDDLCIYYSIPKNEYHKAEVREGPNNNNPYGTIQRIFDVIEIGTGSRLDIRSIYGTIDSTTYGIYI